MQRVIRMLMFMILLVILLPACQDADLTLVTDRALTPPQTTVTRPDLTQPLTLKAELPPCLPEAVTWQPGTASLPEGLRAGSCALTAELSDANADGQAESSTLYTYAPGMIGIHYVGVDGTSGSQTVYGVDAANRLISLQQYDATGTLTYAEERTLDPGGQIVSFESKTFAGYAQKKLVYSQHVTQTFARGKLTLRHEWTGEPGQDWTFTFTYDEQNRLTEAVRQQANQQVPASRARWAYDAQGRPVQLQREINGKPSLESTWTWTDAAHLQARTVAVHLGVGGTNAKLDNYDAPTGSNGAGACYGCQTGYGGAAGTAPWPDAMPAATATCQPIPTAVGHGYPDADYAIAGDWQGGQDSSGGYGYYGYGYGYGSGYGYGGYGIGSTWYGHAGAGSNWDALAVNVPHSDARFELTYDAAGRMIREQLSVQPTDPDSEAPRNLNRRRIFAGQLLTEDRVEMPVTGKLLRKLVFLRDEQGRLLKRELRLGEVLAETTQWMRDPAGRATDLAHYTQADPYTALAPTVLEPPKKLAKPQLMTQQTLQFDTANHVTDEQFFVPDQAEPTLHLLRAYDDRGHLRARTQISGLAPNHATETLEFDVNGHETLHTVSYGDAQNSPWFEAHTYNAAGLVEKIEQGQKLGQPATWRQMFTYDCQ